MEIINIDEHFSLEQYCKQYVKEHDEWPTIYAVRSHTPLFKTCKNYGVFTEYSEAERAFEANRFVRFADYILEEEAIELVEYSGPQLCFEVTKRKALRGRKIMLAIKPEYVEEIFDGLKRYEYRKKIPNHPISQIVIYETAPVSKVVGKVDVDEIISQRPDTLYRETERWAGISKDKYDKYFGITDELREEYFRGNPCWGSAYAYSLNHPVVFSHPVPIEEYGLRGVPQSYVYLEDFQ